MASVDDTDARAFPYRLRTLERIVEVLQEWRRTVDSTLDRRDERFKTMEEKVDTLVKSMDALRRVLVGFALTIAGSAIAFALTVLIATGKL